MHRTKKHPPHTAGRVLHRAWLYDLLGTKMSKGRDTLLELAAPEPHEAILDVGCGTGTLALAIASDTGAADVTGIDASPEMIELARRKGARASSGVKFQVAVIEDLPFPNETFDLVTSSLMLHHLPTELERAGIGEVRPVLRPGGRFLAMDFARESHSPAGHVLSILGRGRGGPTADALGAMLTDSGFPHTQVIPTGHTNLVFVRAT